MSVLNMNTAGAERCRISGQMNAVEPKSADETALRRDSSAVTVKFNSVAIAAGERYVGNFYICIINIKNPIASRAAVYGQDICPKPVDNKFVADIDFGSIKRNGRKRSVK